MKNFWDYMESVQNESENNNDEEIIGNINQVSNTTLGKTIVNPGDYENGKLIPGECVNIGTTGTDSKSILVSKAVQAYLKNHMDGEIKYDLDTLKNYKGKMWASFLPYKNKSILYILPGRFENLIK
jgi:hypothetical protein